MHNVIFNKTITELIAILTKCFQKISTLQSAFKSFQRWNIYAVSKEVFTVWSLKKLTDIQSC